MSGCRSARPSTVGMAAPPLRLQRFGDGGAVSRLSRGSSTLTARLLQWPGGGPASGLLTQTAPPDATAPNSHALLTPVAGMTRSAPTIAVCAEVVLSCPPATPAGWPTSRSMPPVRLDRTLFCRVCPRCKGCAPRTGRIPSAAAMLGVHRESIGSS